MLNKPKFMIPSTNVEECVVDAASYNGLNFSCIVDGNEPVYAWQIKIYRLSNNILVYDTGKIQCESLFFPIDEKNRNVVFSKNLNDYNNVAVLTETSDSTPENPQYYVFKNDKDEYYWTIEMWSYADREAEASTVKSCEEVFYANSTPTTVIKYSPDKNGTYAVFSNTTLVYNKYYFKASYEQAENIPIKRYGWQLTDVKSGRRLIDTITSNQIYGIGDNIVCSYDGFTDDSNYELRVYIETQNGAKLYSAPVTFSVVYQTGILDNSFTVESLTDAPAIMTSWADATIISGEATGKVQYVKSYPVQGACSVEIPKESYIEYNYGATSEIDISDQSYMVLSMQMDKNPDDMPEWNNEALLFSAEGTNEVGVSQIRKLWYKDGAFHYFVTGETGDGITIDVSVPYLPSHYVWYIITMSPYLGENGSETFLRVSTKRALNGLYPSNTQYPSNSLYPSFGIWEE